MRTDDIGLFWEDLPQSNKRGERALGPMPPIPETGWAAPRDFPNLRHAPVIGLDTETYDPQLKKNGPGWARRTNNTTPRALNVPDYLHPVGSIVGVSVATPEQAWYFPMRHTIHPETNMNPDNVLLWLKDTLVGTQPKVGTNLIYDVGWLQEEGVAVGGELWDISHAEALLTETGFLNLDAMAKKYVGGGKVTNLLYRWCSDWYGGSETDQRKNIWRSPPSLVGHYAEADALLPLQIFTRQASLLKEQGLYDLFLMECRLTRLLIAMRFRGVRVDPDRAQQVDDDLTGLIATTQDELNAMAGSIINVNAGDSIAPAFDRFGLKYPLTPKSEKPSFTIGFLKGVNHPIAKQITQLRTYTKLRDTFIRSYILESHVGGRVYGQYHSMRNEGYGTRSGRLSSSNPNLTNIPARDPVWGPVIRSVFVPEPGQTWVRYDYSQIEYRFLLHFAVGIGADAARALYHSDPDTDYHRVVQLRLQDAGRELGRKPTKNINFGLIYGMGEPTLANHLQMNLKEAKALFRDYHTAVPYVKTTMDLVSEHVGRTGFVQTILGRRSRFDLWGQSGYHRDSVPLTRDAALRKYGTHIERQGLHKALNRLLQGSAADFLKKSMLTCWEEGLFEGDGLPLLTVHDELDFSAINPAAQKWNDIQEVMETVMPLKVPVKAAQETGPDWGHLTETE